MKIITLLSLLMIGLLVYLIWAIRRQPGQVIMVPMSVELEHDGQHGISIDPAEAGASFDFMNESFWNPDE